MTGYFPAQDQLAADNDLSFAAWRIYMHLHRHLLDFVTPREVKVLALCATLRMGTTSVVAGLNYLVAKGYVSEHAR